MEEIQEEIKTPEEVLKELKKNTVAKTQFDELQQKYNKLYAETANGMFFADESEQEEESEEDKKKHFEEVVLAKKAGMIHGSTANMKLLLDVDDYLTSHGQRSCFAPSIGDLTEADEAMCSAMHDALRYAVDNSDGSDASASVLFANCINASR